MCQARKNRAHRTSTTITGLAFSFSLSLSKLGVFLSVVGRGTYHLGCIGDVCKKYSSQGLNVTSEYSFQKVFLEKGEETTVFAQTGKSI